MTCKGHMWDWGGDRCFFDKVITSVLQEENSWEGGQKNVVLYQDSKTITGNFLIISHWLELCYVQPLVVRKDVRHSAGLFICF